MIVKTALFGNDPNWGRILAAVGRSGAEVDTGRVRVELAGSPLFANGLPTEVDPALVSAAMKRREILIRVELGLGNFERTVYTTDLSREYVSINADYTT
jgi:glutamate N-acetyltransferase/amino-acid N-acetyltransferase